MAGNHEHRASVCLQFIRRAYCVEQHLDFYEGIIYEDNLYTLKALLLANRVMFLPEKLFHRRLRAGSIMTSPEGFKNFHGYFTVYCEAIRFISKHKLEESIEKEVEKEINCTYKAASLRIWSKLSASEQVGFRARLPMLQRILLDEMVETAERRKQFTQMENQNRKLSKELRDIRQGYSFRIGRIVTWFPRKIRGGIHCFRQHGAIYTAKRVLEHMGFDMGTGVSGKRKG